MVFRNSQGHVPNNFMSLVPLSIDPRYLWFIPLLCTGSWYERVGSYVVYTYTLIQAEHHVGSIG